jgi:hypothetical protein
LFTGLKISPRIAVPQPNGFVQVVIAAVLTVLNLLWPYSLFGLLLFIRKQWARKVVRGFSIMVLLIATVIALLTITGVGTLTVNSGELFGYQIPISVGIAYGIITNILIVLLLGSRNTISWYEENANK